MRGMTYAHGDDGRKLDFVPGYIHQMIHPLPSNSLGIQHPEFNVCLFTLATTCLWHG